MTGLIGTIKYLCSKVVFLYCCSYSKIVMLWWASSKTSNRGVIFWLSFLLLMLPPLLPPSDCLNWVISVLLCLCYVALEDTFSLWGSTSLTNISVFLFVFACVGFFCPLKVSGYPGSHGIPAMAGSIYPGQASLLDQADSWNHRPQEISVWQPNMEVWDLTHLLLCSVQFNTLFIIINRIAFII